MKNQILPITQFAQIFGDLPHRLFVSKQEVRFNLATLDLIRKLFRPTSSGETPTKKYHIFICAKEMPFCISVLDANNGIALYQFVQIISILDANGIILYQFASDGITTITLRLLVSCTVCYVVLFGGFVSLILQFARLLL